jgi:alanyl-tRNA synthetase
MELHEVRSKYLAFFKERGHTIIPSSSLVPENDPTTLFTGSGMQPLLPYLLGKNHPSGSRLVDSQKAFRSGDIEEVGDNRHTTFFEMLGNWSLGDYFKKEQINWFWEFLTGELGLDPQRIFVTCYIGNPEAGIPKDTESAALWKEIFAKAGIEAKEVEIGEESHGYEVGEQGGRIFFYSDKNWWSRSGAPSKMPVGEPGGPDTEMFYLYPEVAHDKKWGEHCHPNCDCGRYIELGNSVFMQYLKTADGFDKLPKQNVDYGGGLERITAAVNNSSDVFPVAHAPILTYLENASEKKYNEDLRSFRIIADHMKAAVFLIGDGVHPGASDQGYFVRRLIRRSVRYADKIGIAESGFAKIVQPVIEMYSEQYPELADKKEDIEKTIAGEEDKFRKTLSRGMKELERFIGEGNLTAQDAFNLVTTYGFPLELILEEAGEKGIKQIDIEGFKELLKAHQNLSRAGSEQKFKGGLADTSEKTTRLHTAHHLLLKALQMVLGPSVHQRGSNITQERLRIDFNYDGKMTDEQKKEVERIVNEKIAEDIPMTRSELPKEEAEKLGAEHEFGAKYPERVSVYSLGPKGATVENPMFENAFSIEFCGGPHVQHTGELAQSGKFRILKEEAVSAGVRRIKAVLE